MPVGIFFDRDASLRNVGRMPGVDAWCALADEVVALGDPALVSGATEALVLLGLSSSERKALDDEIRGREDPAGQLLGRVVEAAREATELPVPTVPQHSTSDMDAALALSAQLLAGPVDTMATRLAQAARAVLVHLPPDAAGSLVSGLVGASLSLVDAERRAVALRTVVDVLREVSVSRLPVADLIGQVVDASPSTADEELVAELLSRVPTARLLSGALDALRGGAPATTVLTLLDDVGTARVASEASLPLPTGAKPPMPTPPPSPQPLPTPSSSSLSSSPLGRRAAAKAVWETVQAATTRWRGGHAGGRIDLGDEDRGQPLGVDAGSGPVGERQAYPRIDVDSGQSNPQVVLFDEPFTVTVGLGKYKDTTIVQTPAIPLVTGDSVELELVLIFDPSSLQIDGSSRRTITVTDAMPYPTVTATFTALYREDLPAERRLGVHYLRDGQIVGIAWKSIVAVRDAGAVATAPVPASREDTLLDLDPLLDVDPPDLTLSICASDGAASGEFVWMAFPGAATVLVPDAPRISRIGTDLQDFVGEVRKTVQFSQGPFPDYKALVGKAERIGSAIPDLITTVIHTLVDDPRRESAPTILLLTEELTLPWELAVLNPPFRTEWGGVSPFLGAHAAISRWPLTEHKPRPKPRASVTVRRAAVLTARYEGVVGWGKLADAELEADEIADLFTPKATTVQPSFADVASMFEGNPRAEILHVALHGQFDAKGDQGGLVVLGTGADGELTSRSMFFTADHAQSGRLDDGPFVFLNACQVAADKAVLGDYGGFASTLLRIGASGVVAPLWNVDDDIAAAFARQFYAATWTATGEGDSPAPVSAAEAVRAQRARYTRKAAQAGTAGISATLIAFQVFGHPRLRLDRA